MLGMKLFYNIELVGEYIVLPIFRPYSNYVPHAHMGNIQTHMHM